MAESNIKIPSNKAPNCEVPLHRLFRHASKIDCVLIAGGVYSAVAAGFIWPTFYWILGNIFDRFHSASQEGIVDSIQSLLTLGVLGLLAGFGSLACWMSIAERQTDAVRTATLRAIFHAEMAWHDQHNGNVGLEIGADLQQFYNGIGERMATLISSVVGLLGGIALGLSKCWQLTSVVLALSILQTCSIHWLDAQLASLHNAANEASTNLGHVVKSALRGIRTVKAHSGQRREYQRFSSTAEKLQTINVTKAGLEGILAGLSWLAIFVGYSVALWFGCLLIREEVESPFYGRPYTGGEVVTVFWSVLVAALTLNEIGPCWTSVCNARVAAKRLYATIDRVPTIDCVAMGERSDVHTGKIEFQKVRFEYPGAPNHPVLRGINLTIEPQSHTAIVGRSGEGKSTILSLLERYYDVGSGEILIDGVNIRNLDLHRWRQSVAIVNQSADVLLGTILDNIRAGHPGASECEAIAAAKAAHIHDFISDLPHGYATYIGEGGATLSGGQRQRLALARAFLKPNLKLLLLDEATSAQDAENDAAVRSSILELMEHRKCTTVTITHRLQAI